MSASALVDLPAGPFGSIVDSSDPNEAEPTRLFDALNVYIPDPINGSAVLARHGFQGQVTQLGTVDHTGQCVFKHRRLDGTIDRLTFGGGRMYRWDGATTFTDITPAGVSIDASNPVFCATFNDEVLVSDEQNKPWIFTPSSGVGVQIEYDDIHQEWNTKGGAIIYGGFPFFIIKAVGQSSLLAEDLSLLTTESGLELTTELTSGLQNTITWGNANDARTGYDQGAFDHNWTLTQAASEILGGLFAEEGALVYLRNEGIGYLTGSVEVDFRSTATKDGISQTRGTDTPAAIVGVNRHFWFLDVDGRVFRGVAGGGEPEELWFPMRRQVEANVGTAACRANVAAYARGSYHASYELVLFTIWDRQTLYAFHAETGRYIGQWQVGDGIHVTAMGSTVDSTNRSTFVVLGTRSSTYQAADLGVVWRQKFPDDPSQWLDTANAGIATHIAITRAVETHWLTHRAANIFRALKVFASVVADSVAHANGLQYVVPARGASTLLSAQSSVVVGEKSTKDSIATARWSLGRNAQGEAMRVRVSATHSDNVQWGVHNLLVKGQIIEARRRAK